MQDYERDSMPYMHKMGIPSNMYPMANMPEQQLEMMYPRIYYIIYPVVVRHCDMMDMTYGRMYMPNREEVERMTDNIHSQVEADVDAEMQQESEGSEERQFGFGFGRRRFLRNLISILLLRELLHRRRRPFFGTPFGGGFGPGFGGGFGGGFGPGFGGGL